MLRLRGLVPLLTNRTPLRQIELDVKEELRWDPEIDETDIAVKVINGAVSLTGYVHSYSDKYQSEVAAKRVAGVSAVANDLEVRLPSNEQLADPEIARNVATAVRSAQLDANHISVQAHDGTVVLEGKVRSWAEREEAQRTAWAAPGVLQVQNHIAVGPPR